MGIRTLITILVLFSMQIWAQDFSGLKNLDGTPAKIETQHKKMLVYFWATWCPDCREHVKNSLPKYQSENKYELVTVVMDKDLDRAKQYIEKEKVSLKTFRDPDRKLSGPLKVFSVPVWAVFEKDQDKWKIVKSEPGTDDEKMLQALGVK